MDITIVTKPGIDCEDPQHPVDRPSRTETFKSVKLLAWDNQLIDFEPRTGPEKGQALRINLRAYSLQRPTEKSPRVTDSLLHVIIGHETEPTGAAGPCACDGACTEEIAALTRERDDLAQRVAALQMSKQSGQTDTIATLRDQIERYQTMVDLRDREQTALKAQLQNTAKEAEQLRDMLRENRADHQRGNAEQLERAYQALHQFSEAAGDLAEEIRSSIRG